MEKDFHDKCIQLQKNGQSTWRFRKYNMGNKKGTLRNVFRFVMPQKGKVIFRSILNRSTSENRGGFTLANMMYWISILHNNIWERSFYKSFFKIVGRLFYLSNSNHLVIFVYLCADFWIDFISTLKIYVILFGIWK